MKTVTGKIVSSTPISVSKVTKIISNFVATDNGASQAVSAYLRRAYYSFNDLKQLHKELQKPSKSDRKHKKSKSETTVEGIGESNLEPSVFNFPRGAADLSQEANGYGDSERNKLKNKNKKKKEKENGEVINFGDGGGKIVIQDGDSKRENEKKEGNFGEDEGKIVVEKGDKLKHKKEKSSRKIENLQGNAEESGGEKKKKKRKGREIEEAIEKNSSS